MWFPPSLNTYTYSPDALPMRDTTMSNKKKNGGLDSKMPGFVFFEGDVAREIRFLTQEEKGYYLDFILAQSEFGPLTEQQILNNLPTGFEGCSKAFERFIQKSEDKYYISWLEKSLAIRENAILGQKYSGYLSGCKRNNTSPMTKEEFRTTFERPSNHPPASFEALRVRVRVKDDDDVKVFRGAKNREESKEEIPHEIEKAIDENSNQVFPENENDDVPF